MLVRPSVLQVFVTPILCVLVLLTAIGNALVLFFLLYPGNDGNKRDSYIASICVADFFMTVMVFPLSVTYGLDLTWLSGKVFCGVWIFLNVAFCAVTNYTLAVICMDLCFCVKNSFGSLHKLAHTKTPWLNGSVWAFGLLLGGISYVVTMFSEAKDSDERLLLENCLFIENIYIAGTFTTLVFLLPFVCCLAVFIQLTIRLCLFRSMQANRNNQAVRDGKLYDIPANIADIQRDVVISGIKLFMFFLSWCPFFVVTIISSSCDGKGIDSVVRSVVLWFPYVSSWINPFIYGLLNKRIYRGFQQLCSCGSFNKSKNKTALPPALSGTSYKSDPSLKSTSSQARLHTPVTPPPSEPVLPVTERCSSVKQPLGNLDHDVILTESWHDGTERSLPLPLIVYPPHTLADAQTPTKMTPFAFQQLPNIAGVSTVFALLENHEAGSQMGEQQSASPYSKLRNEEKHRLRNWTKSSTSDASQINIPALDSKTVKKQIKLLNRADLASNRKFAPSSFDNLSSVQASKEHFLKSRKRHSFANDPFTVKYKSLSFPSLETLEAKNALCTSSKDTSGGQLSQVCTECLPQQQEDSCIDVITLPSSWPFTSKRAEKIRWPEIPDKPYMRVMDFHPYRFDTEKSSEDCLKRLSSTDKIIEIHAGDVSDLDISAHPDVDSVVKWEGHGRTGPVEEVSACSEQLPEDLINKSAENLAETSHIYVSSMKMGPLMQRTNSDEEEGKIIVLSNVAKPSPLPKSASKHVDRSPVTLRRESVEKSRVEPANKWKDTVMKSNIIYIKSKQMGPLAQKPVNCQNKPKSKISEVSQSTKDKHPSHKQPPVPLRREPIKYKSSVQSSIRSYIKNTNYKQDKKENQKASQFVLNEKKVMTVIRHKNIAPVQKANCIQKTTRQRENDSVTGRTVSVAEEKKQRSPTKPQVSKPANKCRETGETRRSALRQKRNNSDKESSLSSLRRKSCSTNQPGNNTCEQTLADKKSKRKTRKRDRNKQSKPVVMDSTEFLLAASDFSVSDTSCKQSTTSCLGEVSGLTNYKEKENPMQTIDSNLSEEQNEKGSLREPSQHIGDANMSTLSEASILQKQNPLLSNEVTSLNLSGIDKFGSTSEANPTASRSTQILQQTSCEIFDKEHIKQMMDMRATSTEMSLSEPNEKSDDSKKALHIFKTTKVLTVTEHAHCEPDQKTEIQQKTSCTQESVNSQQNILNTFQTPGEKDLLNQKAPQTKSTQTAEDEQLSVSTSANMLEKDHISEIKFLTPVEKSSGSQAHETTTVKRKIPVLRRRHKRPSRVSFNLDGNKCQERISTETYCLPASSKVLAETEIQFQHRSCQQTYDMVNSRNDEKLSSTDSSTSVIRLIQLFEEKSSESEVQLTDVKDTPSRMRRPKKKHKSRSFSQSQDTSESESSSYETETNLSPQAMTVGEFSTRKSRKSKQTGSEQVQCTPDLMLQQLTPCLVFAGMTLMPAEWEKSSNTGQTDLTRESVTSGMLELSNNISCDKKNKTESGGFSETSYSSLFSSFQFEGDHTAHTPATGGTPIPDCLHCVPDSRLGKTKLDDDASCTSTLTKMDSGISKKAVSSKLHTYSTMHSRVPVLTETDSHRERSLSLEPSLSDNWFGPAESMSVSPNPSNISHQTQNLANISYGKNRDNYRISEDRKSVTNSSQSTKDSKAVASERKDVNNAYRSQTEVLSQDYSFESRRSANSASSQRKIPQRSNQSPFSSVYSGTVSSQTSSRLHTRPTSTGFCNQYGSQQTVSRIPDINRDPKVCRPNAWTSKTSAPGETSGNISTKVPCRKRSSTRDMMLERPENLPASDRDYTLSPTERALERELRQTRTVSDLQNRNQRIPRPSSVQRESKGERTIESEETYTAKRFRTEYAFDDDRRKSSGLESPNSESVSDQKSPKSKTSSVSGSRYQQLSGYSGRSSPSLDKSRESTLSHRDVGGTPFPMPGKFVSTFDSGYTPATCTYSGNPITGTTAFDVGHTFIRESVSSDLRVDSNSCVKSRKVEKVSITGSEIRISSKSDKYHKTPRNALEGGSRLATKYRKSARSNRPRGYASLLQAILYAGTKTSHCSESQSNQDASGTSSSDDYEHAQMRARIGTHKDRTTEDRRKLYQKEDPTSDDSEYSTQLSDHSPSTLQASTSLMQLSSSNDEEGGHGDEDNFWGIRTLSPQQSTTGRKHELARKQSASPTTSQRSGWESLCSVSTLSTAFESHPQGVLASVLTRERRQYLLQSRPSDSSRKTSSMGTLSTVLPSPGRTQGRSSRDRRPRLPENEEEKSVRSNKWRRPRRP